MYSAVDSQTLSRIKCEADRRAVENEGCRWRPERAARVKKFAAQCKQSLGDWYNKPLVLLDWQNEFIDNVYGWERPDGSRRIKRAALVIPKKNGKTTLAAMLGNYHAWADGERGAKVYLAAYDGKQAELCYAEAKSMLMNHEVLGPHGHENRATKTLTIRNAADRSSIQLLTAGGQQKEGLNASFVLIDELHVFENYLYINALRGATAARASGLFLSITTAGQHEAGPWFEELQRIRDLESGANTDTSFYGIEFAADPNDDWRSQETWSKANPSLGVTVKPSYLESLKTQAETNPVEKASFLRYHLNVVSRAASSWIDPAVWEKNVLPLKDDWELDTEYPVFLGLDLSMSTDLTAMAVVQQIGDKVYAKVHLWTPSAAIDLLSKADGVDYASWVVDRHINICEGAVINYEDVSELIDFYCEKYQVKSLNADPYNALILLQQARIKHGISVFTTQQNRAFSPIIKSFNESLLKGGYRITRNPCLDWQSTIARVTLDANKNIKLVKPRRDGEATQKRDANNRGRIDGVVALILAHGGLMASIAEELENDGFSPIFYLT